MRKLLMLVALVATQAFAEASFDQIESLIQQKNYAAAEAGLEVIVKNHPQSAKAFYAMAQAQAGLGNLEKAQKALNIATGLNPTLDFAPEGSVQKLKQAITPQTAKIEAVHETSFLQYLLIITLIVGGVAGVYVLYMKKKEREDQEQAERDAKFLREEQARQAEEARKAKLSDIVTKPAKQPKATASQPTASIATTGPAVQQPLYTPQPTHTTVVNNTSSNDGLLTGILIGDMMNRHHDTPRVVEREVIREVPASRSTRDSSWDDTTIREEKSSSRSSSWDDDSSSRSSSRSSSWDSDSSSSSSSSWSSSSSSDSSSSWSSSSSDSGSSSSSWD